MSGRSGCGLATCFFPSFIKLNLSSSNTLEAHLRVGAVPRLIVLLPLSIMDPVTALGVASGILTFLTFSAALLKVGHGVCVTSDGRNEQNMTREVVIGETNAFLDQLMPADDPRLRDDEGLCRLVLESRRIAKDIIAILDKVKPTKSGTVANLRSAIRHVLSKPDMEDLEKRMDQCRSQLDLHLNSGYL